MRLSLDKIHLIRIAHASRASDKDSRRLHIDEAKDFSLCSLKRPQKREFMQGRKPKISVVVPVYNESGNVLPLANEIADALEGRIRYELILVDDCSSDDTLAEINSIVDSGPGACCYPAI